MGHGFQMIQDQIDVEAYIKTNDVGPLIALLSHTLGTLEADESILSDDLQVFTGGQTRVIFQASEDGFLGVWVRGSTAWISSTAFARHLAAHFSFAVRCDPGDEFPGVDPYSSVILHIEGGRERLVTLT